MSGHGTSLYGLVSTGIFGWRLDLITLDVFSNPTEPVILWFLRWKALFGNSLSTTVCISRVFPQGCRSQGWGESSRCLQAQPPSSTSSTHRTPEPSGSLPQAFSQLHSPKTRYFLVLKLPGVMMRLRRVKSRDRGCSRQNSRVNFHPRNYLSNKTAFWAPMGSFCQQWHWYLHFQGRWARCQWRSGWGRSAPPQR